MIRKISLTECKLEYDSGSSDCDEKLPRYFFDVQEGNCKNFTYSGCDGNSNNFQTPLECLNQCQKPGLHSFNHFIGFIKNVKFNDKNILNPEDYSQFLTNKTELVSS